MILWWTKRHWGRFSPSSSVSPANLHSTNLSIIIITRGWHNKPIGGRSAEWTQLDSTPHYTNSKNYPYIYVYVFSEVSFHHAFLPNPVYTPACYMFRPYFHLDFIILIIFD
jgi:hypothetical protein